MGEKFAANPVTGTGSMSVPIATSPGRSGFGPQLGLSYDSGAGNGPFGFGWSLSMPAITRKTDKGLPRYRDWSSDPLDADVFVLSGAEDLVPVLRQGLAGLEIHDDVIDGYRVRRYRPRIEGLFARIERWQWIPTSSDPRPEAEQRADLHWRSISKDNILTIYGADARSRIADPLHPERIFSWLICESRDDKGNGIRYLYKQEDGAATLRPGQEDPFQAAHQRNRGAASDQTRTAQRYLQRILYGNRKTLLNAQGERPRRLSELKEPPSDSAADWLFEVRFDYGELDEVDPTDSPEHAWFYRPDAFSSYRSGFEVRTCRRCERVLMLHHIPGPDSYDGVVRSTDFTYDDELDPTIASRPIYSFLKLVEQKGWKQENGTTTTRSLPPLEFRYSQPRLGEQVEEVDSDSLENLPIGLDGGSYRWVDLHGEGLPGILTEQAGQWFYKRNLSPISQRLRTDEQADVATFAPLEAVASRPNTSLAGGAEILDLAGDGLPDVVNFGGPVPGLYEHDGAEGWQPFRAFISLPTRDFRDPNLRFIDLNGDGHADLVISEADAFVWHPSMEEKGFGAAERVSLPWDEEQGPRVIFADGTESIHLADLSGDGLSDVVRIRNGEVCYWPNLGYGHFGAKVSMDNAPRFDHPELFNPNRLLLADIDGSGTTDLIYLHAEGVRLYFNQAGNAWSPAVPLAVFPPIHNAAQVTTLDLLGNGTACLVWSSPLPGDSGRQMRYVKLMVEQKPHLLTSSINNLGAETRVRYCSSLRFYLEDKLNGKPWITRLPFPVQVVERVETIDHISRNRFISRYAYHHGYFDGDEREFRGFGMVEQWDSERLDAVAEETTASEGYLNKEAGHTQPPVHTKTWFHTGVFLDRDRISRHYSLEYFREPGLSDAAFAAQLLPDTVLPADLSLEEEREACRALKGSMLRQEIYADDAGPNATPEQIERAQTPYTVAEQNLALRRLQPRGANPHAVFLSHPLEAITYHYERNPADPRIQHALTLEVDGWGNGLKQAAIGYGRRHPDPHLPTDEDRAKQTTPLLTYTENSVTIAIAAAEAHRAPLPCESVTYELTGFTPTGPEGRFQASDLVEADPADPGKLRHRFSGPEVAYEAIASGSQKRRPIERVRTLYRPDDLGVAAGDPNRLLELGQLESKALPGESYKLAFTPGLLNEVFQRPRVGQAPEELLPNAERFQLLGGKGGDQGGYLDLDGDGHWWLPSGRSFFSPDPADAPAAELAEARQHFFLPRRTRDPFGQHAFVDYDDHELLMAETRDALNNRVTVESNDNRVLQPALVSDPNRNQTEVAFDALGMVVGTAVMGKPLPSPVEGDSLSGFMADLSQSEIDGFVAVPVEAAADPKRTQATVATHNLLADATTRIVYDLDRYRRLGQPALAATIARETHMSDLEAGQQSQLQVSFSYSDGFGREIQKKIQAEPGPLDGNDPQAPEVNPRWVGSGWSVFNNKGKPVRQYEPFFSGTHGFEFGVITGVSPVLFYDPAERVIATLHPNHTYEKVVFDPWRQTTWDVNDTCAARNGQTGDPRSDADIGGYVADYFQALAAKPGLPWETWYDQRLSNGLGGDEKRAAERAAAHADTPITAHFDALGRPFLSVARNRVVCPGHALDGTEESFATRMELDIEGNQRTVRDAIEQAGDNQGRVVMRYVYDMLGNRIHQSSMEAGERWMLSDVSGKPIRAWDSRDHRVRTEYDVLRRPSRSFVIGAAGQNPASDICFAQTLYGESPGSGLAAAQVLQANLRGRPYKHYDTAGVVTSEAHDFKGNLLRGSRQLLWDYKATPDWSQDPPPELETERFASSTRYDALNRPIQVVAPHGNQSVTRINVIQPTYNEANLLERVDAWLGQAAEPSSLLDPTVANLQAVTNIDYDAKGQRTRIAFGNGALTEFTYDDLTFRLVHLKTSRVGMVFQDLFYTYDPAANITHIRDDAQQTVYYNNQVVRPDCDYYYDAIYRLIRAAGREHIGQLGKPPETTWNDELRINLPHPGDGQAMRNYTEHYWYDAVGNFEQLIHQAANGDWTRTYAYSETCLIEAAKQSNRLSSTSVSATTNPYSYDAHGNMTGMPHLSLMQWDFKDQLSATSRQVVNATPPPDKVPETTFYVYDAGGQRTRKVTERQNGSRKAERIYLGGFEVYREFDGSGAAVELERETLHIMDDKQRVALVETRTQGDDGSPPQLIRYQFGNHLGSASLELDDKGSVISYEEYFPYGSTSYQAVDQGIKAAAKRYRYTGKERDEETGLNYHGARYYASWLGRWVSCDPGGLVDGANTYRYAGDHPLIITDPTGTQGVCDEQQQVSRPENYLDAGALTSVRGSPSGDAVVQAKRPESLQPSKSPRIPKSILSDRRQEPSPKLDALSLDAYIEGEIARAEFEDRESHRCYSCETAGEQGLIDAIEPLPRAIPVRGLGGSLAGMYMASGLPIDESIEKGNRVAALATVAVAISGRGSSSDPLSEAIAAAPEPPTAPSVSISVSRGKPVAHIPANLEPPAGAWPSSSDVSPTVLPEVKGNKTVAASSGGLTTLSGWGKRSQIGDFNPAVENWNYHNLNGTPFTPHGRDLPGAVGSFNACHAEAQQLFLQPGIDFMEVSKSPCISCLSRLSASAVLWDQPIVVLSPNGFQYFFPWGSAW